MTNLSTVQRSKGMKSKDYVSELLNWDQADEAMERAISPYILQVIIETGKDAMQQIGINPSVYDPFAVAIRKYLSERIVKISGDVNDETEKQLRASIGQGVNAGESGHQIRARVEAVLGIASTMRADLIATTEVARAQSYADVEAWFQSGVVEAKEWHTAKDEKVCKFCGPMHGRIVGLEENYFNKGDVQIEDGENRKGEASSYTYNHSYDNVIGAPLHPRCRCTLLPVRIR